MSNIYDDKKVFARTFPIPTGSCFSIKVRKNHRSSARLQGIQYRVSIVRALVHFDCKFIGYVIAFGRQIYGSYPIHGVIHVTLQHLHNCSQYQ